MLASTDDDCACIQDLEKCDKKSIFCRNNRTGKNCSEFYKTVWISNTGKEKCVLFELVS